MPIRGMNFAGSIHEDDGARFPIGRPASHPVRTLRHFHRQRAQSDNETDTHPLPAARFSSTSEAFSENLSLGAGPSCASDSGNLPKYCPFESPTE